MKYQSELIKEIVEARGHEKSSLHYESECVETWIKEVEGAYPKLCDYQSEWLNYIIENPIGNFPYEIITDVTEATVNNVVPYAYKSAILSGNTLVNLVKNIDIEFGKTPTDTWGVLSAQSNRSAITKVTNIKPTTKYLIRILSKSEQVYVRFFNDSDNKSNGTSGWLNSNSTFTTLSDTSKINMSLRMSSNNEEYTDVSEICNIMLIEYQEGMENWDIPYFEGMQSVKMPGLTTTGKNFCSVSSNVFMPESTSSWYFGNGVKQTLFGSKLKRNSECEWFYLPDGIYTFSYGDGTSRGFQLIAEYEKYSYNINNKNTRTISEGWYTVRIKSPSNLEQIRLVNLQIEKGSNPTSYEPYKSNILTVNEDVELRDIKDTKYFNGSSIGKKFTDVLDCINGELKIQTNKVTMDGNKQPILSISKENVSIFKYKPNDILINPSYDGGDIFNCDKLNFVSSLWEKDEEGYCYSNNEGIMFSISNNKFTDINEYLSQNPITFIYPLAQESIKTVDLSIQDQEGNTLRKINPIEGTMHIHSDGTPLKPSITMEIPVEATTQNLCSFIEEE